MADVSNIIDTSYLIDSLCEKCRQINFAALRGPNEHELEIILGNRSATSEGRLLAEGSNGDEPIKVNLGTLERIRKSASACGLCSLFLETVEKQGAYVQTSSSQHQSLDTKDVYFRADPDTSYCAYIEAQQKPEKRYVVRRLSLTAYTYEDKQDSLIARFDHVAQLCYSGELGRLDGNEERPEGMAFGGRKRQDYINTSLMRTWIDRCSRHPQCSIQQSKRTMNTFRLIDVQSGSIRIFQSTRIADLHYVALSYVWGGPQKLRLTTENTELLQQPNYFRQRTLPKTLADSMELVRLLGLQYLWVDALCIQQDSDDDKKEQIGSMADIYSAAFITITAAAGKSVDAGLPGVTMSRQEHTQREVVLVPPFKNSRGISVINCLKGFPTLYDEWFVRGQESPDMSVWSKRGWCLQEGALSKRKLTVTEQQMFWTCASAYWCEESYFEIESIRVKHFQQSIHKIALENLLDKSRDPWLVYSELVDDYSRRQLGLEGDVADAFGAVCQALERETNTSFYLGLPRSQFELALMWETNHGVSRRTALSTLPDAGTGERIHFPSWSWMGWKGQCDCNVSSIRGDVEQPSITCYTMRLGQPSIQFCKVTDTKRDTNVEYTGSYDDGMTSVTVEQVQQHLPNLKIDNLLKRNPSENLLFFWTESTHFRVISPRETTALTVGEYSNPNFPEILSKTGKVIGRLCKTRGSSGEERNYVAEFIQVGLRQDPTLPAEIMPPKVLVLEIERDEFGIASRVNYGEIDLGAWEGAGAERGLVVLA